MHRYKVQITWLIVSSSLCVSLLVGRYIDRKTQREIIVYNRENLTMFRTPMAHSQKSQAFARQQRKPWWIPKTQNKTKQQQKLLHYWLWFFYHTAVKLETNNKIIDKIRYKFLKNNYWDRRENTNYFRLNDSEDTE